MNHLILTRLPGGVTLVVFLGWFVLPSCHCQWDAIFGDGPEQIEAVDLAIVSGAAPDGQPCHCDDCPAKAFEMADEVQHRLGLHVSMPLEVPLLPHDLSGTVASDNLSRGPPPEFAYLHQSGPRTYLRQLSLRL